MSQYQSEADQLIKELQDDLNNILQENSEGSKCMKLLHQELDNSVWKGRFYGYYKGKLGYFQFAIDLRKETLTIGEEVEK